MNDQTREVLLIAQEECAEVTQAISKCFRFGLDNYKPGKPKTNREHLAEEIGDLLCMVELMITNNIVSEDDVNTAKQQKFTKLQKWSKIQNLESV
jgi:NTP pyrophosphatase (non-canonical NTP hydrolase)